MFEVFCTINTYVKIPSKYELRESFLNFPIKFYCVTGGVRKKNHSTGKKLGKRYTVSAGQDKKSVDYQ